MSETASSNNRRILSQALTHAGIEYLQKQWLHDYHIDFVFPGHRLLVEVESDLPSGNRTNNDKQKAYETERDAHLQQLGYQLVRYSRAAIRNCTNGVVQSIQRYLAAN